MFSLELNKEEYQFIYKIYEESLLQDNFDLSCSHCKFSKIGNCNKTFCEKIKYKLRKLLETL